MKVLLSTLGQAINLIASALSYSALSFDPLTFALFFNNELVMEI